MTRPTVFSKFLPNERYYMLHKYYWFLALNVVVLYILVFVYYGFCEIIFFCYMYIFRIGKTVKKRKKKEEKNPIWENCYAPMSMIY